MVMRTQAHAWSCPVAMAEARAGSSICLVCSLPIISASICGTPSPAASGVTAHPGNKEKLGQKEILTEVNVTDVRGCHCLLVKINPSGGRSLLRFLSLKRCHIKGMRGWSSAGLPGVPLCGAAPPWGPPCTKGGALQRLGWTEPCWGLQEKLCSISGARGRRVH